MTTAALIDNPFPGLRSFEPEQAELFFGRDEQIEDLLERLQEHRFLAVVGSSGSGKSSLVRAGLIPALERGYVDPAIAHWRIAMMRPGRSPTIELCRELAKRFDESTTEANLEILSRSNAGLAEFARQHLKPGEGLLVVVDQFEELFRYHDNDTKDVTDESASFVKFLLAATGHSELPLPNWSDKLVYVVITMRSDFLGRCSLFRGLPEALNDSQYLVPRLSREQQRDVIEGPIAMAGASIEPSLVQRLLNDVGDKPDQLPVLQHVLMRTWEEAHDARATGKPIEVTHYEAVGGMSEALNRDADQALAVIENDEESKKIARWLFQRLVEPGAPDGETRRPTPLSEIIAVTGSDPKKVREVIEVFRSRGFITISGDDDPIVDIAHESLIRNWKQLGEWVQEESRWAAIYRRLVERAELFAQGEEQWLLDPQLQLTLDWREDADPNRAWAERYRPGYARAISFLEKSAHARTLAEQRRKQKLIRARLTAIVLGSLFLVAAAALIFAAIFWKRTSAERDRSNRLLYDANVYFAQRAAVEGGVGQARRLLEELLPPSLKDLRGFEWFHLWRVVHEEEATLSGHTSAVNSVAFSPDGKTLATASDDNTVKLWDTASRKELTSLSGHSSAVYSVAFSPDGKSLATASVDRTVKLWDIASGRELATLSGHSGIVESVAFSPDGKTLASASDDQTVKLWDTASRKELASLSGHSGNVESVAFSPDGKTLASASDDQTVKLWDTTSRKELTSLSGHSSVVNSVVFSPDGKTLATASDDHNVKLWDTASHKELATFSGHSDTVESVAFSSDGKTLASASDDHNVKLWDTASHKELATLPGHSSEVISVAFSPDGKTLASASDDQTVKLWDTASRKNLATLLGHSSAVISVAFAPDGKSVASSSVDHTVKLWDTVSRKELATLSGHSSVVNSVVFSPDGKTLASASDDQTVKLWDTASRKELATLSGHSRAVGWVVFSPDGKTLASASDDQTVKLWDTASRKELATLSGHSDSVQLVAFSPDGKTLASASKDHTIKVWDTASRKELATLFGHSDAVRSVAFSPDGKTLASASDDHNVKLWDTASRKELATLSGHSGIVSSVEFSPDGKTLASAGTDQTVKLWDTTSGKELATLVGHSRTVYRVAFSPDGKTLASASADQTVKLWFAATEEEVAGRRKRGY